MTTAVAALPDAPREGPVEFILATVGFLTLIFALPFVLVLSGPFTGWLIGAVLFTASWAAQRFIVRMSERMDPTHAVGTLGISSIGRAFVVVGILFVIALKVDETIGLVAAGVFAVAFTFDLMGRSILFSLQDKRRRIERDADAT